MSHTPPKGRPLAQSRVDAARSGSRVPVFAIALAGLVVVLVAAALAVVAFGGGDDDRGTLDPGDQAFGPVTATGSPLPTYEEGGDDPAVGQAAPMLEGESPSGEPVTIDPSEGPMVVAFLAHWCPHCQAEVPRLVELADGSDEIAGVPFVAVLTSSDPNGANFPPGEWLADEDWPAPAMVDTDPTQDGAFPVALTSYGLAGYPYLVGIDGDGTVVARSSGELGDDGLRALFEQVADAS